MRAAIFRLEANYREPLMLQVLFGYSTEEIANQLEISVPAVLTRLYRARHLLRRKMLGEQVDESEADELP
jgi:RNA polymerase sigma-70 factor (ECF subfamily)